jgi:hypothetical protein
MTFRDYVRAAWVRALADQASGEDGGELRWIHDLCRRGVRENWLLLTAERFLTALLWCVGSVQRRYTVRVNFWDAQLALFRGGDASRIARERDGIRAEWSADKCCLNRDMVEAVIEPATTMELNSWERFRERFLLLPDDPEADTPEAWSPVFWALRQLAEVGPATAWYLIRNLYGGPVFKPDVHIDAIARHFFGTAERPVEAMTAELRRIWPVICTDPEYLPLHVGEVDYVLWWYRSTTGIPVAPRAAKTD